MAMNWAFEAKFCWWNGDLEDLGFEWFGGSPSFGQTGPPIGPIFGIPSSYFWLVEALSLVPLLFWSAPYGKLNRYGRSTIHRDHCLFMSVLLQNRPPQSIAQWKFFIFFCDSPVPNFRNPIYIYMCVSVTASQPPLSIFWRDKLQQNPSIFFVGK